MSSDWPLCDLWPHECITFWSKVLLTTFGSHWTVPDKLISGWPLCDLWPHKYITLWSRNEKIKNGFCLTKFDLHTYFGYWIIAFLHINWLICIFLDKLTSGWHLCDLWLKKCILPWSRVLLIKFDFNTYFGFWIKYSIFANQIDHLYIPRQIDLWLTLALPLTPQMYYTLVKGSFDQIWLTYLLRLLNYSIFVYFSRQKRN